MSNILFVLYHDFSANSAVHVHNFANELARRGHQTSVAFPGGSDTGAGLGAQRYSVITFPEVDGAWSKLFPNGAAPDLVHAWTPRENVRLFCEKLRSLCQCRLVVHLEDNEELILEVNLGSPFAELAKSRSIDFPHNLAHPHNYRRFLGVADGVTIIMDTLERFVPADTPRHILWPGADRAVFSPRPRDEELFGMIGIEPGTLILCYTGNVHSANAHDVRSLYLAAAILSREGTPTVLVRTGRDFCEFLGPDEQWARSVSIDLGHVDYDEIARVLSLADFLVQPGAANAFNEYRLPGKLPEFFAMGRPIILPATNVGRFVRHGEEAWVLPKVDALGIVNALRALTGDSHGVARLARGAVEFTDQHFSWEKNTGGLLQFYGELLAQPIGANRAAANSLS
ncbi:MAG: glycosyltransferase family 4 protein [Chthoniobacterales bacterium]